MENSSSIGNLPISTLPVLPDRARSPSGFVNLGLKLIKTEMCLQGMMSIFSEGEVIGQREKGPLSERQGKSIV